MASRLALIKQPPARVLDWWAPMAGSGEALRAALPDARVAAVFPAGMSPAPESARDWRTWWARLRRASVAMSEAELAPSSADLLWSNMGLHFSADPPRLLERWRELIAPDGFLMFSTLGPGTLEELAALYRSAGWGPPMAPFVDMHDLGDMLVRAGFGDPVMDQEQVTLTWPDAAALLGELRSWGGNAAPDRHPGLRTPRWRNRLLQALAQRFGAQGRLALRVELVYGHAFCPPPKPRVQGETRIAAADLQAMARRGRAPGHR